MPFVVDASMAAASVVADERTPAADVLLGCVRTETGCVPDLFWHEMRNPLVTLDRALAAADPAAGLPLLGPFAP